MSSDSSEEDSAGEWDDPPPPQDYEDPRLQIKYTDFKYCVNSSNDAEAAKKSSLNVRDVII